MKDDAISRQAAIDYFYALINAENPSDPSDEWNYSQERINQTEVILHHLEFMPAVQPEQRYTEEELRVFQHGISLSLLSKRSAQHWRYDEDTATEIKFLERLYEKVGADIRGEEV